MNAIFTTPDGTFALAMRRKKDETFDEAWARAAKAVARIESARLLRLENYA